MGGTAQAEMVLAKQSCQGQMKMALASEAGNGSAKRAAGKANRQWLASGDGRENQR